MTRWLDPHPVEIPASFQSLGLPPLIAQTLLRRGISSHAEAEAFLHPEKTPPSQFPNIEEAVNPILLAIRNGDKICVWGDFDVDGQTSTALLVQTLRTLNANVTYYVPVRGKESHGVHIASLKPIIEGGAKLLLTCDTGLTAHEASDFANSHGLTVIITDHHTPLPELPPALAIVNPRLPGSAYPFAELTGVGVAFKLLQAVYQSVGREEELAGLMDLVALGTIADMAPLLGENRYLVKEGLKLINTSPRMGIRELIAQAGLSTGDRRGG